MTDSRYLPKDVIEQFIALYRSCPALWKVDSKEYRSQYLKNCAYDKLIKFCRERVNVGANKDFVAKRIQGLRGSFRKEVKKAETGRKPTLWYYDLLLFTKEQDENCGTSSHQVEETSFDGSDDGKFILSAEDIADIKQEIQSQEPRATSTEDTVATRLDTRYWSKDVMVKFIEIYKSFPCLWKISCDEYKNKQLKSKAYENLVAFVQDIYPEADRDFVIRKIQSLRGVFRKHYNKYVSSKRTAITEEDIYKPDLWYFDLLLFLKDDEEPGDSSYEYFTENDIQSISKNQGTQATDSPLDPRTYIENLIKMYKAHPCLWKVGSEDYTNKSVKAQALKKIVNYSKKIYPHADRDFVMKKIQSLRSAFRKEHKKIVASKECATSDEDIYMPTLWYYDLLAFVEEDEMDDLEEHKEDGIESDQQVMEDIIEIKEEPIMDDEENQPLSNFTIPQKGVKRKIQIEEHDFESSMSSGFDLPSGNTELTEYEAVGINVSKKLKRMDPTQAIYAEALIVKLLGMGLLRKLSFNTDIYEKINYQ